MKLKRRDLPLKRLPSGHQLTAPLLSIAGDLPGKKVYIQSGTHGGELAGHGAIWGLLSILAQGSVAGSIHLVPQVNPVSFNQKVGDWQLGVFDHNTGSNWNRIFKLLTRRGGDPSDPRLDVDAFAGEHRDASDAEVKAAFQAGLKLAVGRVREHLSVRGIDYRDHHALTLQGIACDADVVLDLHTGDTATHYVYAPPWRPEAMRALDVPHHLILDDRFAGAMDEATICPWLMLADAFGDLGRTMTPPIEGYTVELGSIEQLDNIDADAARIANFLRAHGVLTDREAAPPTGPQVECAITDYHSYAATESGLAVFEKRPGERVSEGEVVVRILSPQKLSSLDTSAAETVIRAQDGGILITRHASPVVYQGLVIFKMMTQVRELPSV